MRKSILSILFLLGNFSVFAQNNGEGGFYMRLGPQIGILAIGKAKPQTHSVDIYTNCRLLSFNFEGGIGYYLNSSNHIELDGSFGGFGIRNKKYKEELLNRSVNYYLYNDFNLDPTGSTGNALLDLKLSLEFIHDFKFKKWKIAPSLGGGIRQINHRDYEYALREKSSNNATNYSLKSLTRPNYLYRFGVRIYHEKNPNAEYYLNLSGGDVNYNYSIRETNATVNSAPIEVKYKVHFVSISIGLKLKISFNDYNGNN